ncbi:MAG TPA: UDP-2,3-diacylglucosamine diphosphatase LpxI [Myxococcales bacterium]|nr:UDP-2,3-diacylglucosamine diphosphatase LpxI [Myxococcales bacterium]
MSPSNPIGLVAGNGVLPLLVAQGAARRGVPVVAAGHLGETDRALEGAVARMTWVRLGQVDRIIRFLRKEGARAAVLAGGIGRVRAFTQARPDLGAVRIIARLRSFRDDHLLRAVADYFQQRGLEVVSPTDYLEGALAPEGVLCGAGLTGEQARDARLGWEVADLLGRADVGQTVAVKGGHVLALEAIEGTDEAIRRAGALSGRSGGVVVKRSKVGQDPRFDLPAVGPGTVRTMEEAGMRALVVEAGRTLLLDAAALVEAARAANVTVVGWSGRGVG